MKQLIQLIAVSVLSLTQINAQTVTIDQLDWSTQPPGATNGQTNNGEFWVASGFDQDGSSAFGVNNGAFTFEDIEGSTQCPCIVGDPSPTCGNNDNLLAVGPFLLTSYCEATISFDVSVRGVLKCGTLDDQDVSDLIMDGTCPSNNGVQWSGTDALEIKFTNSSSGEERTFNICGTFSETGTFSFSEIFDIEEEGTALILTITGGTQLAGASYDIGNINVVGIPRQNATLNAQIITNNDNNVVCEGIETIIVQTAANPNSQYTWAFPDGSTISGNISNGRDKLTLQNITPAMSGIYRVTVVDDNQCELYDQLDITILSSSDAQCLARVSFSKMFPIQCSTESLPLVDDNGITGTWSPSADLEAYAGQTLTFTFIPDDPAVRSEDFLLTIEDLSNFANFASRPTEIPILCNAADTTYDFIEMFNMNYNDFKLVVSGDLDLFDFIPSNTIGEVNQFINEFRNIDVRGVSPRTVGFQIDGLADCGADPITKSFFVTIIDDAEPIRIDTALCAGDYFELGNYKIYQDTVIKGDNACDTMLIAKIKKLKPQTTVRFAAISAACGEGIYYYDTIVGNRYIGFVKSPLVNAPPYGPNFDTLFTETFLGTYTLPIPASNGCDSIQKVSFSIGRSSVRRIYFDLCSNRDTLIRVGSSNYLVNKDQPYRYLPVSGCDFVEIKANILPAISDTLPSASYCKSEVIPVEISPGEFMNFDASMTYPFTVELDHGSNGCPATFVVDFTFIEPSQGTYSRRICPGETFTIGNVTFDKAVVNQKVTLSGAAASGCDSIVSVTVTVVQPQSFQINETICPEDNYTFEGSTFDASRPSGLVVIPSSLGCDSLVYNVQLNFYSVADTTIAPKICPGDEIFLAEYNYTIDVNNLTADLVGSDANGCAQNVLIRATIDDPVETAFAVSICNGEVYNFAGVDHSVSGSYSETLLAASGCDSISTLNLTVLPPVTTTNDGLLTICQGLPVVHFGKSYFQPGNYQDTLQNDMGCDSIVQFSIDFIPMPEEDLGVMMICPDESLNFLGKTYNNEGRYQDTMKTNVGCDSILVFEVVFHEIINTDIGILYTCPDSSVDFLGQSYNAEGTYSITLNSSEGCDSIVSFQVQFHEIKSSDMGIFQTCPGTPIDFNGQSYDTEGNYTSTFQSSEGCDSLVSFELVFFEIPTTDIGILQTCPGSQLDYNGQSYDTEGNYMSTFQSSEGCDSLVSFELVFFEIPTTDIGILQTCTGTQLDFNGQSYNTEGSYTTTFQSSEGCDSLVSFELVFFQIPTTDIGVLTSCPKVPVEFMGNNYDTEGNYSITLNSSEGCDSVITFEVNFEPLEIVEKFETICPGEQIFVFNNAFAQEMDSIITHPGGSSSGCDTTVHLIITYFSPLQSDSQFTICEGEEFSFGGRVFDAAVVDEPVRFQSKESCDSIVYLTIKVLPSYNINLGDVQICGNTGYSLGDTTLFLEGQHSLSYTSWQGCDSTIQLNIVRVMEFTEDITATLCPGTTFDFNGKSYDTQGIFYDSLTTTQGCDSIFEIEIIVVEPVDTTRLPIQRLCFGTSLDYNGNTYDTAGEFVFDMSTTDGCDSVVVMTIEIIDEKRTVVQAVTCSNDPYLFEGQSFATSGSYPIVYLSPEGCDSTVVLDLIVHQSYEMDLGTRQVCTGSFIEIGGFILDQQDVYILPLLSKDGCDSLVTVRVDIVDVIEENLGTIVLCDGDSYNFAGQTITQSGLYTDTQPSSIGCDSITTVNIEVTPQLVVSIKDLIGSCEGGANGAFVIESIPGASPPFSVFGLEGVAEISSFPFQVNGLASGEYHVDFTDANGCMTFAEVVISDDRENALTIDSIIVDPRGQFELILNYNGEIATIEWEDKDGLSCYDCPNPSVDIEETTTFHVTVIDVEGCISSAEITLKVDDIGSVYFPNVISPNSAYGNHRFFPQTERESNDAHFDIFIFDRWGNKVYEMLDAPVNDISFGWNGRYSDNRINTGVFVYSVRIFKENGIVETFKGDLTVIE